MKKIVCGICALVFCLSIFAGCGEKIEYRPEDYLLEIFVDKTVVTQDDTVTVTAKVTNISGRDLRVQLPYVGAKKIEQMISVGLELDGISSIAYPVPLGRKKEKITFKKNTSIQKIWTIVVDEPLFGNYADEHGYLTIIFIFGTLKAQTKISVA